ncbi:TOX high mobility group box family member 4 [Taenia solium]
MLQIVVAHVWLVDKPIKLTRLTKFAKSATNVVRHVTNMEDVEHPSQRIKRNEPPKKKMPLITTYNSDEEEDDEIDDFEDMSLAEMRTDVAPFPACDLEATDLTDESTPPPSSDSSSDTEESNEKKEERGNVASLMSKSSHMSLVKLLNSNAFQQLRRMHSSSVFEEKEKVPRSFVVFFHETLSVAGSHSPPTTAMTERNFGEIVEDALARWKRLSPEERRVYRKRALHSKTSYVQHLLDHRTKLRTAASQNTPRCTNPPCQQPVAFDTRWNLDYCSAACLVASCKTAFKAWLGSRPHATDTPIPTQPPLSVPVTTVADHVRNGDPSAEKEPSPNPSISNEEGSSKPTDSMNAEAGEGDQGRFRGNLFDRIQTQSLAPSDRLNGDIQSQKECS